MSVVCLDCKHLGHVIMHKSVIEALACEAAIKDRPQCLEHEICSQHPWKQTRVSPESHRLHWKDLPPRNTQGFFLGEGDGF